MTTNRKLVKLPQWTTYMHYSSGNYGAHALVFSDANGNNFYFSYKTLVAFRSSFGGGLTVHENAWGPTTGKHLNAIDGGGSSAKRSRLSSEEFEAAFVRAFGCSTQEAAAA